MREEEGSVGVDAAALARRGTASVETPVPGGEDEDVGDPECGGGLEQDDGGVLVRGQGRDEEAEGPDHVESDDGGNDNAEDAVEGVHAAAVCEREWDAENEEDDEQEPVGTVGEGFREGEAEAADGEQGEGGGPARLGASGSFWSGGGWCVHEGRAASEVLQIVDDLGGGPVLSADEFAADDAVAVDDVGFGGAGGVKGGVGALGEVEDGSDASDVVIDEVLAVGVGVGVEADGEDDDVGHAALEFDEGGEFFETGRAPAGPEIEDDDFALALVLAEAHGLRAVANDDGGGAFADLGGVAGAVAAQEREIEDRRQETEKQRAACSV